MQNQEAMICELMRTDKITVTGSLHNAINSTLSEYKIKWKDNDLTLDVMFFHISHLENNKIEKKKMRKLIDKHQIQLDKLSSNSNSSVSSLNAPSMTVQDAKLHIHSLVPNYPGGLVIVANIGVWYNSREKYRRELPKFLTW